MSRTVRTARGRQIDMAALATKHETTKAVGNVLMNARGDRINADGTIRYTAEQIARADQNSKQPPQQTAISDPKPLMQKTTTTVQTPVVEVEEVLNMVEEEPVVEPIVELAPEAVSKITRTRDDGTKYMEIEYDDGSIETVEIEEE
jgi:hypothetical protein